MTSTEASSSPNAPVMTHVKRIPTLKNSIFYSFVNTPEKQTIEGYGRKSWRIYHRDVLSVTLDESSLIINEYKDTPITGEDPRAFVHNGTVYVQDNYLNDCHLYNTKTKEYLKVKTKGKNLSFISHKGRLYFIYYMSPFIMYEVNMTTGDITTVDVEQDGSHNGEYRGGTPGYKYDPILCFKAVLSQQLSKPSNVGNPGPNYDNIYYGFGHRVYYKDRPYPEGILKHDVFMWVVDFEGGENGKPSLHLYDVSKPVNAKNVCDPTSVISVNNKKYMVTAESNEWWFVEQEYVTNLYELTPPS